jgi:hypothetical protein
MKVNVRRSADAEEAMREWREKSDRSETISSDSISISIITRIQRLDGMSFKKDLAEIFKGIHVFDLFQ